MDPNYQQPDFYTTTPQHLDGQGIGQKIHHSRIFRCTGIRLTERTEAEREGWGLPVAERVWDALRQYNTIYEYTEGAFKNAMQAVMKIKGLNHLVAHDEDNGTVIQRLQLVNYVSSVFNMVVLDEGEDWEMKGLSFGGIPEIMIRVMDKLAGATGMPLSILFGQPPTGLSTDDQSGRTSFYDSISLVQEEKLRPPLEQLIGLILASKSGPTGGAMPDQWSMDFQPLMTPTQKEEAETDSLNAQTDQVLISNGVISPEEARSRHLNNPNSPYVLDTDTELAIAETSGD